MQGMRHRAARIANFAPLVALELVLAVGPSGCHVDLLNHYEFTCTDSTDCMTGYMCVPSRRACVKAATTEPGDVLSPSSDPGAGGPSDVHASSSNIPDGGILTRTKSDTQPPLDAAGTDSGSMPVGLVVTPSAVKFGAKLVGQLNSLSVELANTSGAELRIHRIELEAGSSPTFSLDFKSLPGHGDGSAPSLGSPVIFKSGDKATVTVRFVPAKLTPLDAKGVPVPEVGSVRIESSGPEPVITVPVSGIGAEKECPTAVVVIKEGEKVIPQTNLHLFGDQSFAPTGAVVKWQWAAKQPPGSASVFVPSSAFPNPTFECNVAGNYQFQLDVWSAEGIKSCVRAEVSVVVIPDEAIHVELVWNTPNDPDQTDQGPEAGSDFDLHFVHEQKAVGDFDVDKDGVPDPWFDQPYDAFWFNAHPNWGGLDPSADDDPSLDRDDTDGAGPENLNLNVPENGAVYRIGVHYWHSHSYGKSFATLRVYIYSNLVWEVGDVSLEEKCLWDAVRIDWPTAKVTAVPNPKGAGPRITCPYVNPYFNQQ